MKTNRRIQLLIFTLIGFSLCVQVMADKPIELNYKFDAGAQIREDVTLTCELAPTETSPGKLATCSTSALTFSIRYPTTTFLSEFINDRSAKLYAIYQPELIDVQSEDLSVKEELQREVGGFSFQRYQIDLNGRLIESPRSESLADSMSALRTPFDFIGALPLKPVKLGDRWTQKIDHPQIGRLTVEMKFADIEMIDRGECAKLAGTVSGKVLGPDNAEMQISDGKYAATFDIQKGVMVSEEIAVELEAKLETNEQDGEEQAIDNTQHESPDLYSLKINYTTKLSKEKTLSAEEFETTMTALKSIESGIDAFYNGNHKAAKDAFGQFLARHPDSQWRSGVETLLAKVDDRSRQKSRFSANKPERDHSPMKMMRFEGFISEWLVLGPLPVPGELISSDRRPQERRRRRPVEMQDFASHLERDFLESVGGEANVRPSPGDEFVQNGKVLTWEHHDLSGARGSLDELPGFDVESGIAYLATYFKSGKSGTFNMELGRGDNNTIAVWINGECVWNKAEQKEPERDRNREDFWKNDQNLNPVAIDGGWNALLIKTAKIDSGARRERPDFKRGPRGRRGGDWRLFVRFLNAELVDAKTSWNSQAEINTADNFNVVLAGHETEFTLTVALLGIDVGQVANLPLIDVGQVANLPLAGIDLLLPESLRNAKVVGDLWIGRLTLVGEAHPASAEVLSTFADNTLKIRWTEKIRSNDTISMNFKTKIVGTEQRSLSTFEANLVDTSGNVVQKLDDGNADGHPENSNGLSGIKVLADKSAVPAPTDLKAEPVFGENDVKIRWKPSDDPRVNGYEILVEGEPVDMRRNTDFRQGNRDGRPTSSGVSFEWTHRNLTPESKIAYTVKAVVNSQLTSQPSETATAVVDTDTTDPMPPMRVEEAIPLGENKVFALRKATRLISWERSYSEDVVRYEILRGTPDSVSVAKAERSGQSSYQRGKHGAGMVKIADVPPDRTEFLDTDASKSDWYQVRAVDNAGNSAVAGLELVSGEKDFYRRKQQYRERQEMGKYLAMARRAIEYESSGGNQFGEWGIDDMQRQLVDVFAEQRALDSLAQFYEMEIEIDPENIGNYNLLAKVYLADEKIDHAVEVLEKTMPLVPKDRLFNMIPYYNLAQAYGEQGNAEKAIATMKQLLEHGPPMFKIWLSPDFAKLYAKFEMFDEVRTLAQELEKTFENPKAIGIPKEFLPRQIAQIYAAGKLYDQAIRWYKELLFHNTGDFRMRFELAEMYDQAGEFEVANTLRGGGGRRGRRGGRGGELRRMKYGRPQAPELPMRTLSEDRIQLSDFSDKLILVNFFDLSEDALVMLPMLEKVSRSNKNLVVIGIAMDKDTDKVMSKIEKAGITYPVVIGTRAIHDLFEFSIGELTNQLPTTFAIIGNENLIVAKREGVQSKRKLQELIEGMKQRRKELNLEPNIFWAEQLIEFSSQYSDSDWSAEQLLGPPDTYPKNGDLPTAWASDAEDGQPEFVKVGYETPAKITGVKIYETYNPGSIERVEAIDTAGNVHQLWQGVAEPIPQKTRIFRIDLPPTEYKVRELLIRLDSQRVPGWNQIDAVGIVYQE